MDRGMVRGQQKCLGSGADLGNVFIKETRSWLMVIVVGGHAIREGSPMRWDETWNLKDIRKGEWALKDSGKSEEKHSRLTWCNASHQTGWARRAEGDPVGN